MATRICIPLFAVEGLLYEARVTVRNVVTGTRYTCDEAYVDDGWRGIYEAYVPGGQRYELYVGDRLIPWWGGLNGHYVPVEPEDDTLAHEHVRAKVSGTGKIHTVPDTFLPGSLRVQINGKELCLTGNWPAAVQSFAENNSVDGFVLQQDLEADDVCEAFYIPTAVVVDTGEVYHVVPSGAIDGANLDFVLPEDAAWVEVYVDGQASPLSVNWANAFNAIRLESDKRTIHFVNEAPAAGQTMEVHYGRA